MSRILIAEDEPRLASFLEKGFRAAGYAPFVVGDGHEASLVARDEEFDLMVLDLGLPGMDGLEVLEAVRSRGHKLPVLILTARADVEAKVAGLDLGAADYVTKPFSFEELLARVRARLREGGDRTAEAPELKAGEVSLDVRGRVAKVADREVGLTAREFALLETFVAHPGHVLSREQLLSRVWGYDYDPGSNVVDVYVRYLRRKLGEGVIETVRGVGYRMRT